MQDDMDTMDPVPQDHNEKELEAQPNIKEEEEDDEKNVDEEQPEASDPTQEDENAATPAAQKSARGSNKPKGKGGKGSGGPKKSSEKSKEPPSKKRKRSDGKENKENQSSTQGKKEDTPEDGEAKTGKGVGSGRKKDKGQGENWTPEIDKVLVDAIKKYTKNNVEAVVPWKETYKDFQEAFPDSQRSLSALKMRWFQHLKHGEVELSEEQMKHFRQAVKDIEGNEKNAAIAWRYKQLSDSDINKGAVAKLLKTLNV
ncbi:hypothetical protein TWF481_007101 [Arthrobotrys musiformis]|uniref:Myb-like domain-containing protein n=1 Tax=Arthrobotrys musiformis TaxID=47236 RepID=A0AAV9WAJ8_9PEZI